jgi:hypothetical protein
LIGVINGESTVKFLKEDLNIVMEWSRMNNMELHGEKFEVISYPLNASKSLRGLTFYPATLEFSTPKGRLIAPRDTVRDLGVYVSGNRSWSPHIEMTLQEARKNGGMGSECLSRQVTSCYADPVQEPCQSIAVLEYCCPV